MDSSTARRNFLVYSGVSTVLTLISISSVVNAKPNFFSLLIALSHGLHILVLSNFLVVTLILFGKLLQTILFGELRLIEREHVYERSWLTLMNMLMAIAMFRDENNLLIGFLILSLLFMKIFHWILVDRIQYIFQTRETIKGILFTRASFTLILFLFLDYQMILSCIDNSFKSSPDVYVIFGFDFALLFFDLFEEFGKLVLNLVEIWYLNKNDNEDVWELKTILMKSFEIAISFIKILTIFFNFFVLIGPYRMPITVMRESYLTVHRCVQQVTDLVRYRRASRELDRKLRDASQEDLDHDDTCIICREEMSVEVAKSTRLYPKKLNCGHVIHLGCLKSWMERSESCPLCRSPVFSLDQPSTQTTNEAPVEREVDLNPRRGIIARIFEQGRAGINRNAGLEEPAQTSGLRTALEETDIPEPLILEGGATAAAIQQEPVYQEPVINLPSNSMILPPDWSLFPLLPREPQQQQQLQYDPSTTTEYDIFLNPTTRGTVKIVKVQNQPANLIPHPLSSSVNARPLFDNMASSSTGVEQRNDANRRNLLRRGMSIREQYGSMLHSLSHRIDDMRSRNNTAEANDDNDNGGI